MTGAADPAVVLAQRLAQSLSFSSVTEAGPGLHSCCPGMEAGAQTRTLTGVLGCGVSEFLAQRPSPASESKDSQ
eukprot:1157828-Pelagomonas_calceolata.AAC.2